MKPLTLLFISLFFSFFLSGQSIEVSPSGCFSAVISFEDTEDFLPLYPKQDGGWSSCSDSSGELIAQVKPLLWPYNEAVQFEYILEIKTPGTNNYESVQVIKEEFDEPVEFFNISEGIYRIRMKKFLTTGMIIVDADYFNDDEDFMCPPPESQILGMQKSSDFVEFFSEDFEMGYPSIDARLIDYSGEITSTSGDDILKICSDEEGLIFLWGNNTIAEDEYMINIYMKDIEDNTLAFNSSGWKSGQLGFEKLIHTWQTNHPNWHFWEGYTYSVQLVVRNRACDWRWISETYKFASLAPGGNCRLALQEEDLTLSLFPNPASTEINIDGLENLETQSNYYIHDLSGRALKSGVLNPGERTLEVNELNNGLYILTVLHEKGRSTLRFDIIK